MCWSNKNRRCAIFSMCDSVVVIIMRSLLLVVVGNGYTLKENSSNTKMFVSRLKGGYFERKQLHLFVANSFL